MQVVNEYRLVNKRGSKVPAVIILGNKWPAGKANPLKRFLYLVLWLMWYTNHGEPRLIQHFPHASLDLLVIIWALRECWINALKFAGVYFFSEYDLHVLPGIKQPLWGIGEMFYFCFFLGGGIGEGIEVLQFWNSWWYIIHLASVTYWTLTSEESMSVILKEVTEQTIGFRNLIWKNTPMPIF